MAPSVDNNSLCEFAFQHPISGSTEVKNFDVGQAVTLHCGNTPAIVEFDLPHTTEVCEEVADTFAGSHVPHLEGPIRPGDDFLFIVLEAGNGTGVGAQCILAVAVHGVPDA